jgi:Bacteriocin-protection, YdeI or OmpD-Associated/Domain of unknown function (DUF1905)
MKFRGTLELHGKTATGISVPGEVIEALGGGKRPPVVVTIGGCTFRTTIAPMGGQYLLGLNAENRTAAGATAGDELDIEIALDTAPREVAVPSDLAAALTADAAASATFDGLSYTHRKEWVRWIEEAKKAETREARLVKTVASLREGKKTK